MKQRLLLVLLALFTSIGWMAAQTNTVTITVPKNSGDVSISVSGAKDDFNVSGGTTDPKTLGAGATKTFKLKNNANSETAWKLTGDFTGLTVSNASVKSIAVNHSTLKTLTASSINLTNITFANASILETVNVSTNQLTEITVPDNVKTLNISGNQISDLSKLSNNGKTAVTYGIQTVKNDVTPATANKWFDVTSLNYSNMFPKNDGTYNYSFEKRNGSNWVSANVRKNPSNGNMYRFQSSTAYEDGTYRVSITNTKINNLTYKIQFEVKPAEFKLEKSVSPEGWGSLTVAGEGFKNGFIYNNKRY